jgi:hypothetical protein
MIPCQFLAIVSSRDMTIPSHFVGHTFDSCLLDLVFQVHCLIHVIIAHCPLFQHILNISCCVGHIIQNTLMNVTM